MLTFIDKWKCSKCFCRACTYCATKTKYAWPVCFNPWITEQKNFLLLQNWVHIVPIFLKLFSQHFFMFRLTRILLMWRIGWAPNSIPVYSYIQQDATLHSLFIFGNCSTCFGWYFHPSSGAHTTVSTASGICHTVTAIWRYRGRFGTALSVLWVAYS